jgi:fatty-acyl-CoA synthase
MGRDQRSGEAIESGGPLALDPMIRGRQLTLGGFLHEVVANHPDNEAIVSADARLTYTGLLAGARRVAHMLLDEGVGQGSRVAILLPNGPDWATAFFGVTLIGGVAVALSTLAAPVELEHMLARSDSELLLTAGSAAMHLASSEAAVRHPVLTPGNRGPRDVAFPSLSATLRVDAEVTSKEEACAERISELAGDVSPDDDAMVLFTSGSTGVPKAVLHAHRAICIQSWRWRHFEDRRPTDRVYSTSPFFWTSGLTRTLGSCLAAGATVVVQERFEPGQALEILERERVTAVLSRHHLDHRLLAHPDFARRDLSQIRRLYPNSPLATRLGPLPVTPAGYGMTETMTLVSQPPTGSPGDEPGNGHVLPGMTVRITDVETDRVARRNVAGRICVRGATLMCGYDKVRREETFEADGFLRTSDLGMIDEDGRLHFVGRLDGMVKVAGANVFPAAVERHVAAMGGLLGFSVFALPHPTLHAALVLCAAVAPAPDGTGPSVDEASIDAYLRSRLATYQVPKRIVLLESEELSFTSSQKVEVGAMRRMALERMLSDDVDTHWAGYLRRLIDEGELADIDRVEGE